MWQEYGHVFKTTMHYNVFPVFTKQYKLLQRKLVIGEYKVVVHVRSDYIYTYHLKPELWFSQRFHFCVVGAYK